MNQRKIFLNLLKLILTLIILYFLFHQVSRHWEEIKAYRWQIEWGWLALSIVVGIGTFFLLAIIWRQIIAGFGYRVTPPKAFRIFYLSNLGRYIPGKIWQLFGILYLTKREGIPPEHAGASFVLVQLFAIPASFLVFVLAVQFEPKLFIEQISFLGEGSAYLITAAMVVISLVIILKPQAVFAVVNLLLRKLHRPELVFHVDKKVALSIFLGYSVAWSCYGVAFWLFLRAIGSPSVSLVAAAGAFNAAYQIGYLALFAPGGFGPRELVLGLMLVPFLGPIAAAVAIAARLWVILIESLAALLALAVRK